MSDYPNNPDRTVVTVSAVDRVHWGPIIAGMFVTLSILIVSMILAAAVGFGARYDEMNRANYSWPAIIWAALTALIAFGVGGYFAARWSGVLGSGRAATHGFLVWALTVPVLVLLIGAGLSPLLSNQHATQNVVQAVQMPDSGTTTTPEAARKASNAAWWSLAILAAGLIGASVAGAAGANSDNRRRTVSTTTPLNP